MNCKYKSSFNKKKAFTLIELLIVIAIIGILFIVLVSKVDFASDKAKASGVQTDFRSFQVALEMVAKENAGFNTFGWDTGDNGAGVANGSTITLNGKNYIYTNASKDAGDRVRNSYDVGDTNLNGTYDDGEVWTGRKIYTETWTGCYTLINPGNANDMSAIFDLETAINKNLDPKLHIVIADDGTITMANGYKDPWRTQYHGRYITNASANAAAKWNTDASMAGSTGDNMDRGAILMYSNGANQKFGTKVKIVGGVVTATVSQIDANHPDNNKMGADDYVLAVVYTYTNGYGEVMSPTWGFSQNNIPSTGNGGNVSNVMTPGGTGGTLQLPAENPSGDLDDYTWSEIQTLAKANLSKDDYKNKYGIEPGDTIVSNGTTYVLVDLGTDNNGDGIQEAGEDYDGFVFMYQATKSKMKDVATATNLTGYPDATLVTNYLSDVEASLTGSDLGNVMKLVDITCSHAYVYPDSYPTSIYTTKMFLPSIKELGVDNIAFASSHEQEGQTFDLFVDGVSARSTFQNLIGITFPWWTRSSANGIAFYFINNSSATAAASGGNAVEFTVVPCFVVG